MEFSTYIHTLPGDVCTVLVEHRLVEVGRVAGGQRVTAEKQPPRHSPPKAKGVYRGG